MKISSSCVASPSVTTSPSFWRHQSLWSAFSGFSLTGKFSNLLLALLFVGASSAAQAAYSGLYLFGDSLSDTGNNAVVFDTIGAYAYGLPAGTLRTPEPTSSNSFIPDYPYASNRYSNGPVWAESFASALGLSAVASNLGGTNYAYGGARVGPAGAMNPLQDFPANFPPSLTTQVNTFLSQNSNAPTNGLYVVAGGGNDARDIITAAAQDLAAGVDPTAGINTAAVTYANYVNSMVDTLQAAGARNIIVWNTPNAGLAPSTLTQGADAATFASQVTQVMNQDLALALADEVAGGVRIFDTYSFITSVANNPGAFGLHNATDACSAVANVASCKASGYDYFFWDGLHPTAAGHQLLANAMIASVPETETYAMMLLGLGLVGAIARRRRIKQA